MLAFSFSLHDPKKTPRYWPNLLILFEPAKVWCYSWMIIENVWILLGWIKGRVFCLCLCILANDLLCLLFRSNSHYTQKNPWVHLMLSKRIDTAIDEVDFTFALSMISNFWFVSSVVCAFAIISIPGYRMFCQSIELPKKAFLWIVEWLHTMIV